MEWMAWTTPTAMFFGGIAALVILMCLWEMWRPTVLRKGFLPMPTTRGDRLFLALLGSGLLHILGFGIGGIPTWLILVASGTYATAVSLWG